MSVSLNLFHKNVGWKKLFLIFLIICLLQTAPSINCLSEFAAPEFDALTPLKPIQEYVEFASYFKNLPTIPDYKFRIDNISTLIQHNIELVGREFRLPAFNCSAQIKCSVKYDEFQLSIRFLDPLNQGRALRTKEAPLITTSAANYGNPKKFKENLIFVFPFDVELLYGTFYPISSLSHEENIEYKTFYYDENSKLIRTNYLALQLYVQHGSSEDFLARDGMFLWKVEPPRIKETKQGYLHEYQLAMSPFVYKDHKGYTVQLRLFLKDSDCYVEVRWFTDFDNAEELSLNVTLVHSTESTKRVVLSFTGERKSSKVKSSKVLKLTTVRELMSFLTENKLLLAVEIQ